MESELSCVVDLDPIEIGARNLCGCGDTRLHVGAQLLNGLADDVVVRAGLRFWLFRYRRLPDGEPGIVPSAVVVAVVITSLVARADAVIEAVSRQPPCAEMVERANP